MASLSRSVDDLAIVGPGDWGLGVVLAEAKGPIERFDLSAPLCAASA